jgi:hypothetical protein
LVWATAHRKETAAIVEQLRSTMAVADWSVVAPQYDNLLTGIA